ncbi:putative fatty acyl-CoA reductase CG5065 isoform X2 [Cydia strobilella]|uniref:putative fatty acyl-CoA reductase CG5065 isoform X2 n=1 Tax=Cydia strobilella TaxID=1100964 RepID=UPI003007D552
MVAPRDRRGALIPQFFAGRSVLITGATGFVGKVLVERLLSTCPDISTLHLLLRVKKGATPTERLKALKDSQVFDVVRQRNPLQLEKLRVLEGDVAAPGLGLTADAALKLQDVSVVFHSAATLKFDEELRKAVDQNVRSVMRLLELCDKLPNMQAFIHVSTAYSNAELSSVEERVYPPPAPLEAVLALTDHVSDPTLAGITHQYIAPKPNTYTFTKALAETVVERHGNTGYPISIFRPTIVISAQKHPFPGWIENFNGPSGVVVAIGKGLLHVFPTKCGVHTDFLPVDIAVDTLIAVAWETAVDHSKEVRVYNCSTGANPTTFEDFESMLRRETTRQPLDGALWYPSGTAVQTKWARTLLEFLLQTVPLHLAEYTARMIGVKTSVNLITANKRLTAMTDALEFFATREFNFESERVRALHHRLSPEDKKVYNLDVMNINWEDHYADFVKGTRKYLLNEKEQDLEKARRHMHKMWFLHKILKFVTFLLFLRVLMQNRYARSFIYGTLRLLLSLFGAVYHRLVHA